MMLLMMSKKCKVLSITAFVKAVFYVFGFGLEFSFGLGLSSRSLSLISSLI